MASYSERFILTVPDTLATVASKIGKAFDPDNGGEFSFTRDISGYNGETPIYTGTITTNTPCEPQFKADATYLMTDADALYYTVLQKFTERWPDLTPPTLAECQAFIAAIIPEVINDNL